MNIHFSSSLDEAVLIFWLCFYAAKISVCFKTRNKHIFNVTNEVEKTRLMEYALFNIVKFSFFKSKLKLVKRFMNEYK